MLAFGSCCFLVFPRVRAQCGDLCSRSLTKPAARNLPQKHTHTHGNPRTVALAPHLLPFRALILSRLHVLSPPAPPLHPRRGNLPPCLGPRLQDALYNRSVFLRFEQGLVRSHTHTHTHKGTRATRAPSASTASRLRVSFLFLCALMRHLSSPTAKRGEAG